MQLGDTPTIDKLFTEWVGQEYLLTLKEVSAYTMLNVYRLHRIIALIGEGSNGKGTYLRFLERLLGRNNCCASDFSKINGRLEKVLCSTKSSYVSWETLIRPYSSKLVC